MKRSINIVILTLIILLSVVSIKVEADTKILVFHRFDDERYPSTSISTERLREIFDYLKEHNYDVLSLDEVVNRVHQGRELPDNTVAITIDDGYKSFYENGLDIFKEYEYPFTIFLNTKAINYHYGDFLNWEQAGEISKYGSIGSHSYAHQHLTRLSTVELRDDIEKSISDIEENLGFKPKFFSYPYGEYNQQVKEEVMNFGFEAIVNQSLGAVAENSDPYNLNRIAITDDSKLNFNLRYQYLEAEWLTVEEMVTGKNLKRIKVKTRDDIKNAQLYISGYGWQRVELKNGVLDLELNLPVKYSRNRIFLKTNQNEISSNIIVF